MPTISMFYGVIISMFYEIQTKHHLPHDHARYQDKKVSIAIDDCRVLAGSLPTKQLRMVQVWVDLHREELQANWDLMTQGVEPFRIEPLR